MNNHPHKCLFCYRELEETEQDYHSACRKKFFGTTSSVLLPYDLGQLKELLNEVITRDKAGLSSETRFSLSLERKSTTELNNYFSIAGLDGHFILKAPISEVRFLPELEDLTLHLARIAQIPTAEHSLIRLESGELAHICQRVDRTKKDKLPMEDMCQLSGSLTEDKYQGSIEKIGKIIHSYSSNPGFDAIGLFELSLFYFLTGCGNMHMKSYALITGQDNGTGLSPAFGLIPAHLFSDIDKQEMALSINNKKKNLTRSDFDALAKTLKINTKTLDNTYKRFQRNIPKMLTFIDLSFINTELKQQYKKLIKQKAQDILLTIQFDETIEEVSVEKEEVKLSDLVEETPTKQNQLFDLVKETNTSPKEKPSNLIDVSTGEIINKPINDPNSRQLNLF